MLLMGCQKTLHLVKSEPRYMIIDTEDNKPNSTTLNNLLLPYQERYNKTMNDVIGTAGMTLIKGKPESTLGNWMCDLILAKARETAGVEVDFALQNYGGIRINELAKGDITRSKIYELMPFDNMLVVVECNGEQTQQMLEKISASGGWPASESLRMQIVDRKPTQVKINGADYDPSKTYRIAMPDYIAHGGDGTDFLGDCKMYNTGAFVRDLLIEGVEQAKEPISVKLDGRITVKQ